MLTPTLILTAVLGAPTIAPEAQPTLDRLFAWYKDLPGASMTLTMKAPMPGMGDQVTTMSAMKPNLFTVSQDMGMPGMGRLNVTSNGTNVWLAESGKKIYSESKAPGSFSESDEVMMLIGGTPGEFFFSLLTPDPEATFLAGIGEVKSHEPVKEGDSTYDAFTLVPDVSEDMPEGLQLVLTVEQSDPPWIHGALMSLPKEMTGGIELTIELVASDWKRLDDKTAFAYSPPEDYTKVDDVLAELMGGPPPTEEAAKALVGKPAPGFDLKSLDGPSVSLASLKGKTVILDFFATWCSPCKKGIPVLMDIADKRADEGVVLYVVDLDEPAEKVKAFLAEKKWPLNVLLTGDSKVADDYMVGGIPHTVIIDAKGNVQFVEIGFLGKEHADKAINEALDKAIAAVK